MLNISFTSNISFPSLVYYMNSEYVVLNGINNSGIFRQCPHHSGNLIWKPDIVGLNINQDKTIYEKL